ncbi:hypothetical protein C4578_03410 [Candidatus Microgenomates bacterium]|jgi:hypothetical protein|nr:MAG: hypothetical protein C4578_03410 [Candidatus Microgenomates bacterium]
MERQSPERGQSAEISFGTVYTFKDKEERREIIIDIGENNTFHSSRLFRTKDGTFGFLFPGTSNPRNIRRIECVWSIEEVIEAAIKGYLEKK